MNFFCLIIVTLFFTEAKSDEFTSPELWNSFKRIHVKHYASVEEENYRQNIFNDRVVMINQHNLEADLGLHTYTLKINQFADMTHDEIVRTMSNKFKMNRATEISMKLNAHIFSPPLNMNPTIPAAVDWRKKGAVTSIIEAQGECASDWAYTATTALEGQHFLKTGKLIRLSAQNLLDCSDKFGNEGCNGGLVNAAFQYIKVNKGVDTEVSYPYKGIQGTCRFNESTIGATVTGFVNIEKGNETSLQIAIATVGPIGIAIDDLHDSFFFYSSGVYDEPACTTKDWSHTMTIVGYDTFNNGTTKQDYYIVKNSWGETFGMHGYIWMSRNKNNQCGIANWASYPLV